MRKLFLQHWRLLAGLIITIILASCGGGGGGSGGSGSIDTDGDGIADFEADGTTKKDLCSPSEDEKFVSTPITDYDRDGCEDAGEDEDDDNDGINDFNDSGIKLDKCSTSPTGFTSSTATDADGDGCQDSGTGGAVGEDMDGGAGTDTDNDGQPDDDDDDDDNDTILDGNDLDDNGNGLIEISTAEELGNIRYDLDGSHYDEEEDDLGDKVGSDAGCPTTVGCIGYELVDNIDLGAPVATATSNWEPIDGEFTATLEGNNYTISNLTINSGTQYTSFFTVLGNRGTVRNLSFVAGSVTSSYTLAPTNNFSHVGVLVGSSSGKISKVSANLLIFVSPSNNDYVGGLVGFNDGIIQDSYVTGTVNGGDGSNGSVGGLVGSNSLSGTIQDSYATGTVNGGDGNEVSVGGLVGFNNGIIQNSSAAGTVNGGDGNEVSVGGLVGLNSLGGIIQDSYATGSVNGGAGNEISVGGLAGTSSGTIGNSFATGNATGNVGNASFVGGLVGYILEKNTIGNSFATGNATGGAGNNDWVGGLVGNVDAGTIQNSYSIGVADGGAGDFDFVGGLVGYIASGTIQNNYSLSVVNGGDGDDRVGSLIGNTRDDTITITGNYYNSDSELNGEKIKSFTGPEATGKTSTQLKELNANTTASDFGTDGWSTNNWNFGSNKQYPSLRSYQDNPPGVQTEGDLLCRQDINFVQCSDTDGDNDGVKDGDADGNPLDLCPRSPSGFTSSSTTDADGDGCQDGAGNEDKDGGTGEDTDNDGKYGNDPNDSTIRLDKCEDGDKGWTSTTTTDIDGDGCQDSGEDNDDDNDNIIDTDDQCPLVAATTDANNDGCTDIADIADKDNDGIDDATDVDDDGDGLIEISTAEELNNIRYDLDGSHYDEEEDDLGDKVGSDAGCPTTVGCIGYELVDNIDLGAPVATATSNWEPIDGEFAATLEGNNNTISNLILSTTTQHTGFFTRLGSTSTVRNLSFVTSSVTSSYASTTKYGSVGVLAGMSHGTISGVSVTGISVTGVPGNGYFGGLVGWSDSGKIQNSYATGYAYGTIGDNSVGGLVGRNDALIQNSYAAVKVIGAGGTDRVGGLVGDSSSDAYIQNSYATGDASGDAGRDLVGGLVGYIASGTTIQNSYATGSANGGDDDGDNVGGLVGYIMSGAIQNSYSIGVADGGAGDANSVGGLVGYLDVGTVQNSYATGSANGSAGNGDSVGGLVGYVAGGTSQDVATLQNSYSLSVVNGGDGDDRVGRLVGAKGAGTIGITSNYYDSATSKLVFSTADTILALVDTEAKGKTNAEIRALTATTTEDDFTGDNNGWSENNWQFTAGLYPSLKSYKTTTNNNVVSQVAGVLLCGQSGNFFQCSDTDGDNDGVKDGDADGNALDLCPRSPSSFTSSSTTDADGDGCQDGVGNEDKDGGTGEDTDNDGKYGNDPNDSTIRLDKCEDGDKGWTSTTTTDIDGDGCQDSGEDNDDDDDNIIDTDDLCPLVAATTDADNDGCQDSGTGGGGGGGGGTGGGGTGGGGTDVDADGDGLIEISTAEELNNIRYDLDGSHYDDEEDDGTGNIGSNAGCPSTGCIGYELVGNIDLGALVDPATSNWDPIEGEFTATLEGGYKTISNLVIKSDAEYTGFFTSLGIDGIVQNLSFATGSVTGSYTGYGDVGLLAGTSDGTISGVSVTGISVSSSTGTSGSVGGLVGNSYDGTIENSYVTGNITGSDGEDYVGGLVGYLDVDGTIKDSYATGVTDGGNGRNYVGGLAGYGAGIIENSYATGNVIGGDGDGNFVGGLVGDNRATIRNSYATGATDGGNGRDNVGGLAGYSAGIIENSYATGNITGSDGGDNVGGLVGYITSGTIQNSYSLSVVNGGDGNDNVGRLVGFKGTGTIGITSNYYDSATSKLIFSTADTILALVDTEAKGKTNAEIRALTATTTEDDFTGDNNGWSENNWQFTAGLYPSLKSYKTTTNNNVVSQVAGVLLCGQSGNFFQCSDTDGDNDGVNDGDADGNALDLCPRSPSGFTSSSTTDADGDGCQDGAGNEDKDGGTGEDTDNDGKYGNDPNDSTIKLDKCEDGDKGWTSTATTDIDGDGCQDSGEDNDDDDDNIIDTDDLCPLVAATTDANNDGCTDIADKDNDGIDDATDVDDDGDGLIEISTAEELNNIRHNLRGMYYDDEEDDGTGNIGSNAGCPSAGCIGYELVNNIDLGALVDPATSNWTPIEDYFSATFEGNNNTISNLIISTTNTRNTGFFESLRDTATVKKLFFVGGSVTGSYDDGAVGVLIGNNRGKISEVFATGISVSAGDGRDNVGGLVGYSTGTIQNSSATVNTSGGAGDGDNVGGLVGYNGGTIQDSSAAGNTYGNAGRDNVGGLVGYNNGTIQDSSAITGSATGGTEGILVSASSSNYDSVGGLVGDNDGGTIQNSSATVSVVGGADNFDKVGGLVGNSRSSGIIRNSYATGSADGNAGYSDYVGGLVGYLDGGTVQNSYAIGSVNGGTGRDYVGGLLGYIVFGTLKNSYSLNTVDGGEGEDDIGRLFGYKGDGLSGTIAITGNYYDSATSKLVFSTADTILALVDTEAKGKTNAEIRALTATTTEDDFAGDNNGWSTNNWKFTDGKYPSLKSYKVDVNDAQIAGTLLCGQSPVADFVQCIP